MTWLQSIALWGVFILGQIVAIVMRADVSASSKFTPWNSVKQYLASNFGMVMGRCFVASLLFWAWWHNPAILDWVGLTSKVPLNIVTAGLYGMVSDKIAEWTLTKLNKVMAAKGA